MSEATRLAHLLPRLGHQAGQVIGVGQTLLQVAHAARSGAFHHEGGIHSLVPEACQAGYALSQQLLVFLKKTLHEVCDTTAQNLSLSCTRLMNTFFASFIPDEVSATVDPFISMAKQGIRLQVQEGDSERALQILQELKDADVSENES